MPLGTVARRGRPRRRGRGRGSALRPAGWFRARAAHAGRRRAAPRYARGQRTPALANGRCRTAMSVGVAETPAGPPRRRTSLRARGTRFPGRPCGRTSAPCRRRAPAADIAFRRSPPLPITIGFWLSRSTQITAAMRSNCAVFLELLDLHRGRVRQLLAQAAHQLLAHQFAGQETLALVGDLVVAVHAARTSGISVSRVLTRASSALALAARRSDAPRRIRAPG